MKPIFFQTDKRIDGAVAEADRSVMASDECHAAWVRHWGYDKRNASVRVVNDFIDLHASEQKAIRVNNKQNGTALRAEEQRRFYGRGYHDAALEVTSALNSVGIEIGLNEGAKIGEIVTAALSEVTAPEPQGIAIPQREWTITDHFNALAAYFEEARDHQAFKERSEERIAELERQLAEAQTKLAKFETLKQALAALGD